MIATIQGKIIQKGADNLILDINGIGFQVFVTNETCQITNIGDVKFLFTQLIVREDALTIYGFENATEKEYFNLLLSVNGVGPRMALSILSTLSIDSINRAVGSEMHEIFLRVPGVGKKTAQKISIHLQGRIQTDLEMLGEKSKFGDVDSEVMDALVSLGYSVVEAQTALQYVPKDAPDEVEERIRIALQYFS